MCLQAASRAGPPSLLDNARAAWSDRYYAPLAPTIVHYSVGSIRRLHGDGRVDTATVRPGVPNLDPSRLARAFLYGLISPSGVSPSPEFDKLLLWTDMSNPDDDTDVPSGLNDDAEMERTSPRARETEGRGARFLQR